MPENESWRDRIMRRFFGAEPVREPQRFQKSAADYAPGVLWLVRSRIAEHQQQYGGRAPHTLILHTATLRTLFADYLREIGDTGDDMPPVEHVTFAAFEGVSLYHCRCNMKTARDVLLTCDGKEEDL